MYTVHYLSCLCHNHTYSLVTSLHGTGEIIWSKNAPIMGEQTAAESMASDRYRMS